MSSDDDRALVARLAARAADVAATVGYSVVPFDGGEAIRVNADVRMPTASTVKVYLLAALYAADVAEKLSLDQRIELRPEDRTRGSGVLKLLSPGLQPTLRDHARLMIVISDNVSTNIVIRALGGPARAQAAIQALPVALPHTQINDYLTFESMAPDAFAMSAPDDFTALLTAIHQRQCTGSATHDREIYWTLCRQTLRSMIPRHLPCSEYAEEFGLPEPYRCGTKSGSMPGLRADVGIVETPHRSWAIAVQVWGEPDLNTGDNHPFNRVVADLSKIVFEAWGRPPST